MNNDYEDEFYKTLKLINLHKNGINFDFAFFQYNKFLRGYDIQERDLDSIESEDLEVMCEILEYNLYKRVE